MAFDGKPFIEIEPWMYYGGVFDKFLSSEQLRPFPLKTSLSARVWVLDEDLKLVAACCAICGM